MTIKRLSVFIRPLLFSPVIIAIALAVACKSQETKAFEFVAEHLKATDPDFKDPKLELFHTNSSAPDKAYIAVSGTRGFVSGSSKLQPDFRGFLLLRDGDGWRIAPGKTVRYTTEPTEADKILAGQK